MRPGTGVMAPLVLLLALVAVAACAAPPPTVRPTPSAAPATPAPTQPPTPTPAPSPAAAPPGTVLVDVPAAGLRLPVPEGWEQVDADGLGDPDRRAEIVARYPGAGTLL
ncbi:MAG TPA: hypothetical protein VES19_13595, partial [Candidatus Limnocylindrales bacterium]|nr:hypothetical protein [Candidatus Limnocylindrales bacterium]